MQYLPVFSISGQVFNLLSLFEWEVSYKPSKIPFLLINLKKTPTFKLGNIRKMDNMRIALKGECDERTERNVSFKPDVCFCAAP